MGVGCSSISHLKDNEYLKNISSTSSVSENDPFWNQLFSFTLPPTKDRPECMQLEEVTGTFAALLFANNQHTGNFTSLVKVFLSRSTELKSSTECDDVLFIWQTCNSLRIIRYLLKFLVENMTEDKIIEQFEACSLADRKKELSAGSVFNDVTHPNYLKQFIVSLMNITVDVPVLQSTYSLHMETLNCLLILLSVQMFITSPSHNGPIYATFFDQIETSLVNSFMHGLFQNYIEQRPSPESSEGDYTSGSFVLSFAFSVASGLKSVFHLNSANEPDKSAPVIPHSVLGHQSSLLILVLINHQMKDNFTNRSLGHNVYRNAVNCFRHIQGRRKSTSASEPTEAPSFHINLSRLYVTLSSTQTLESSTLILYSLLHGNDDVKAYILSKTDIDSLVLPVLKILYIAPSQNSHHIYMALIVLLILTEDDHFNKSVYDVKLINLPWYTDRALSDVTLGDAMILVILRTIQFNMYQLRDRYLHTNCLAALANMSTHFRSINSYAAQRIFELISALAKRHKNYLQKLSTTSSDEVQKLVEGESSTLVDTEKNYTDEVHVLEEVIRMLLEIVNSCFTTQLLRHNSHLVYALLQKHEAFEQLKQHAIFQDVLQNIETVITFFISRLDQQTGQALTIEEVHHVINEATLQLPSHCLHKFPELKFRYIEEESPEDFFVPYVWSLVFNKSGIFWNPGCVQLFNLEQ